MCRQSPSAATPACPDRSAAPSLPHRTACNSAALPEVRWGADWPHPSSRRRYPHRRRYRKRRRGDPALRCCALRHRRRPVQGEPFPPRRSFPRRPAHRRASPLQSHERRQDSHLRSHRSEPRFPLPPLKRSLPRSAQTPRPRRMRSPQQYRLRLLQHRRPAQRLSLLLLRPLPLLQPFHSPVPQVQA